MPLEHKIERIDSEADIDRCQAVTSKGQCTNKRLQPSKFCAAHGGNSALDVASKKARHNYFLGKWHAQVEDKLCSPTLKSLREEIGILRMMLENRFKMIEDESDLMMQSGPISEMIMKIEKLVTSCHKLENSMGHLLDKSELVHFANETVALISDVLDGDTEKLTRVSDGLLEILRRDEDEHA